MNKSLLRKKKRTLRVRKRLRGTIERPRLCVRKTNKHLHIQIIDDENGVTIASTSTFEKDDKMKKSKEMGYKLGEKIAKKALDKKIKQVIFDRGPSKYHGVLAQLADGARKAGLQF